MGRGVGKSTPPPRSAPRWRRPGRRSQWSISMSACANLDLLMGASRRGVFDLRRPERREAFASPHPRQTGRNAVAPAGLADRDKGALTEQGGAGVIKELCGKFDWVICDSPAGIERGATLAMRFADTAVIVPTGRWRRYAIPIASWDFSIPRPRRPRRGSASILIT